MDKAPECPKCADIAVQRNAGLNSNIPYWYCQTCKDEVKEEDTLTEIKIVDKETGEEIYKGRGKIKVDFSKAKIYPPGKYSNDPADHVLIKDEEVNISVSISDEELLKEFERMINESTLQTISPDELDKMYGVDSD